MSAYTKAVASGIRKAIDDVDDESLQGGMARAAAEYLAAAWDTYDDGVAPECVESDIAEAGRMLHEIAAIAGRAAVAARSLRIKG